MEVEDYVGTPLAADGSDLPSGTVPLSRLVTGDSPRLCGENSSHARMLAFLRDALPPIIVHRPTMRVIDGMHRPAADRIISSYPRWSDRVIASVTGLCGPTVAARRRRLSANNLQSDTRIGMDGRIRPVDPAERRQAVTQLLTDNPGASLCETAQQAGLSPETVRKRRTHSAPANGTADRQPPATTPLARADEPAQAANIALRALRADPAFRSTDSGRALLRLLAASRGVHDSADDFIANSPAHCLGRLAAVATAGRPTGTGLGRPGGGAPRSRAAGPAARRPWTPRRKLQALTPGSAISEGPVRGRLRMLVFGRRVSKDSAAYRTHTRGHRRPVRVYRARRDVIRHPFRSERAGEIHMVSRASATLNPVIPTLLACLAALRLGHAAAFLPASIDHKLLEPPDSGTESWLQPHSASCLADQR